MRRTEEGRQEGRASKVRHSTAERFRRPFSSEHRRTDRLGRVRDIHWGWLTAESMDAAMRLHQHSLNSSIHSSLPFRIIIC